MDTDKIRILLKVLEMSSLTGAAEALDYTPSGISRAVSALEADLGQILLIRDKQGIRPTSVCEDLLPAMRRLLASEEALRQASDTLSDLESGRIRIGIANGNCSHRLVALISAFFREHPGVRLTTADGTSSQLAGEVQNGEIDLAFISKREGSFDWIPLGSDRLVAVLPVRHPAAGNSVYPLSRLSNETFIDILPGKETDNSRLFEANRISPALSYGCQDTVAALTMVEAGLGMTIINEVMLDVWHGRIVALPLDPPRIIETGIAVAPSGRLIPAVKAFISYIRSASKGHSSRQTRA